MSHSPIVIYEAGTCSFGSLVVADWMQRPFRACRVTPDEMKSDAYARLNPRKQVPALVLGDRILTESLAVLWHLVTDPAADETLRRKYVYPAGTREFDRLNQVMSFLVASCHSSWVQVFHPYRYADDKAIQKEIQAKAIGIVRKKYEQIENKFLDGATFFAKPTIADAYFYGMQRWGDAFFDVTKEYPRIGRFREAMSGNPSVQFALALEANEARPGKWFEGRIVLNDLMPSSISPAV